MRPLAQGRLRAPVVRVALMATAIVAGSYLVIALVVLAAVNASLTSQVDQRLQDSLARLTGVPTATSGITAPSGVGPRFGPVLLIWLVRSDGSEISGDLTPVDLPAEYRGVSAPTTVSISGTEVRLAGTALSDDRIIVGQTMDSVSRAEGSLIVIELAIAPPLLAVVLVGALLIGRRVAAPVESARQRQMEFTADASHELRTPLSVIEAQTSLALARDHPKEWYRQAFVHVDTENKRIRTLVDDMLWLARFDATSAQPAAELVDVGVLAQQAVDRFAGIAETRGLALTVVTEGDQLAVSASPDWLDRLVGVLIDNACRYTPEGGTIGVSVVGDGARVRLAVDDSGPGIPAAERARIFDRFHRATDAPGGAGLGLAIADAVVKGSGGRWEIGGSPAGGASMAVSWARGHA